MTFSKDFFTQNRKELLKRVDTKLIVIAANNELQRSGDSSFPFRQDSNFWYLTGIDEPNFVLVIAERQTYLIKPNRHWVKDIFDGEINDKSLSRISGIDQILDSRKGWQKLTKQLNKTKKVSTLLPMVDRHFGITANPARRQMIQKMKRRVPAMQVDDIRLTMAQMRMVKQRPELDAIQRAVDITCDTLKEIFVEGWYKNYAHEYEIEAAIDGGFRKRGADGNAFHSVVGTGKDTCQIHPMKNNGPLTKGELILVDIGAEVSNYSADISRTLSIGPRMSRRQKEVFDAVNEVSNYAKSIIKPGVTMREYEQQVEEYMGQVLKKLGVIKRINRRNIRKHFPHMTSHMMGLDTHDAADYSKPFEKNMVMTVEPGIYIPSEKIGIRTEDDVVIQSDGIKVISADLPITLGARYNKA